MSLQLKRFIIVLIVSVSILLVPFLAQQFTDEVNWSLSDFLIAGLMLFGTGILIDFLLRKIDKVSHRIIAIVIILLVFMLIWAELAVGIFGSPFAGN